MTCQCGRRIEERVDYRRGEHQVIPCACRANVQWHAQGLTPTGRGSGRIPVQVHSLSRPGVSSLGVPPGASHTFTSPYSKRPA